MAQVQETCDHQCCRFRRAVHSVTRTTVAGLEGEEDSRDGCRHPAGLYGERNESFNDMSQNGLECGLAAFRQCRNVGKCPSHALHTSDSCYHIYIHVNRGLSILKEATTTITHYNNYGC